MQVYSKGGKYFILIIKILKMTNSINITGTYTNSFNQFLSLSVAKPYH